MKNHPYQIHTAMLLFCALVMAALSSVSIASTTADHSKFEELDKDFKTGPEVTQACLSCHTEAAKQIHKTKHWNWEVVNPETGQKLGLLHCLSRGLWLEGQQFRFHF